LHIRTRLPRNAIPIVPAFLNRLKPGAVAGACQKVGTLLFDEVWKIKSVDNREV